MLEEIGPEHVAAPPAGAMEAAMRRGRTIRRQRRTTLVSAAAVLSVTLIGGFSIMNPLRTNHSMVTPATHLTTQAPVPADHSPIPVGWSSEKKPLLDFGVLTKVTTAADGTVTLHLDREEFYTGAGAKARNHGQTPMDDYLIHDTDGSRILTFTLDPEAAINGCCELRPHSDGSDTHQKLTVAQFLPLAMAKHDSNPQVWLRHTNGLTGPVTAVTEQFTP